METTMENWLMKRAFLSPQRTALVFEDEHWTFGELNDIAQMYAEALSGCLKEECRIAILMKNRPETVFVIHALGRLGVEIVCLNNRLSAAELAFQLQDSKAEAIIYADEFQKEAEALAEKTGVSTIAASSIPQHRQASGKTKDTVSLSQVCTIMYTSGTTGKPKGVRQTFGNHWWSATGSALNLGLHEEDAWLCAVPVFHISGLSILMRSVIYGMPVYLMEQFDEKEANRLLASGQITIMSVVSSMLLRMIDALEEGTYHPRFRCMLLGGGPAPRPLLETCKTLSIPVFQTYGMTETSSQIVTLSPQDSLRKLGSAGKPLFPSSLKIIGRDGEKLAAGKTGEIAVQGPNVTSGYLDRPEANRSSFQQGWFLTGDLGYIDQEGYLYVQDRRSDLIISGGENIYPAEIEEVLLAHGAVKEAGVTGVEDEKWGQVPHGFVAVHHAVSEQELLDHCRESLASYKVPKRIHQVPELPRNGANKLLRRKLLESLPVEERDK